MQFSREEYERYQRHFSLSQVGEEGQLKLKNAKVLVIGAGGLGSPILLYLAAAGVGTLSIIDPDRVSISNLQRQVLYGISDIDQEKAKVALNRLNELNNHIDIRAICEPLTQKNAAKFIRDHDLIIDGTDNFETRYIVNDTCVVENKAFVFGAIYRFDAQISVFNYNDGPCYRCLYPTAPPLEAVSNCTDAGVLGVLPGTVGTLMATEALKIILNIGEVMSGRLLIYDSLRSEMFKRKLNRRLDCVACGSGLSLVSENHSNLVATKRITLNELENVKDIFILDVRQENEFDEGHLPKATHISLPELREKISLVPRDRNIILVCKSGKRSARAAEILNENGFKNLYELGGGMDGVKI